MKLLALCLTISFCARADAEFYINEIFIDPGGAGVDDKDEYIELRGTPNASLDNHYLIFIENENDASNMGPAGEIDNIFDLTGRSMGSNGFLTFRQKYTPYSDPAPGTTDLVNMGPDLDLFGQSFNPGYGSGANSTIGASDQPSVSGLPPEGTIENGGFTAMIIRNDGGAVPQLGVDVDTDNDGTLDANFDPNWVVIDAIGIHGESSEAEFGALYAMVNFGTDAIANPRMPEGATYTATGWEIEYAGRWGNSTGQTEGDWHISNLTDDSGAGSAGLPDWRQSFTGAHPPSDNDPTTPAPPQAVIELESSKGVPYGTKLTDTLGAPNYLFGDYNKDGVTDLADYTVWRNTLGQTGTESAHPAADQNHDFMVDGLDYDLFRANFGSPVSTPPPAILNAGGSSAVPEPTALCLIVCGLLVGYGCRRIR